MISPASLIVTRGVRATGMFSAYRVCLSSPERMKAPNSTSPPKSRVVVAGGVPTMVLYFYALIPPAKPSGPSCNMRTRAFS